MAKKEPLLESASPASLNVRFGVVSASMRRAVFIRSVMPGEFDDLPYPSCVVYHTSAGQPPQGFVGPLEHAFTWAQKEGYVPFLVQ